MDYLRNSILATVIYYDIFDYPLTLLEVYKYLINPARFYPIKLLRTGFTGFNGGNRLEGDIGEINLGDITKELDRLVNSKILGEKNGFYFIYGKEPLFSLRIERHKIADRKWKKFLRQIRYLSLAPYLRGVFASGSMAINNTTEESDFDILVIAKSGRLYTCRLFLWLISSLLGVRRKKDEKIAPDKLCFNHYLTDFDLRLVHQSIFNAQTYINLRPAMIKPATVDHFYTLNLWLNDYAYNFKVQKDFARRSVKAPLVFIFFALAGEFLLNYFIGNWFEELAKRYQQKKIRKNPKTYQSGGRVVFTNQELEFHPQSFEKTVLAKYKEGLKRFGIVPFIEEHDSGLIK